MNAKAFRQTFVTAVLAVATTTTTFAHTAFAANVSAGDVTVNGSGATFPQPLYEAWAFSYTKVDPTAKINYSGGGSGQGKKDIIAGTVDFAGTDAPLSDGEANQRPMVQIPVVAGAVVVAFNLPGVKTLTLDGTTLGKIYGGQIAKWNDAAIAALNKGVNLPNIPIIVVHRSDGSGTTSIFTTYLTRASTDWSSTVTPSSGSTVDWPVDKVKRGLGGRGNQGVAAAVQKTRGSVGYVELSFAVNNKIPYTKMINIAGKTIDATPAAVTAAMGDAAFDKRLKADIANSKDPAAWPISGFTYVLFNKDYADCAKAAKALGFFTWGITSEEGKAVAAKQLYAALPASIVPTVGQAIKSVTCNNGNTVFK